MTRAKVDPAIQCRKQESEPEFRHFAVLDGLRGIAVLIVMAYHLDELAPQLTMLTTGGFLGVDIFFVLSGFLITSVLLNEYRQTSTFSLSNFFIRRFFRLTPALWVFLFFVLAFGEKLQPDFFSYISYDTFGYAFTYTINWKSAATGMSGQLNHIWSLSIEEQFYIVWALLLYKAFEKGRSRERIATATGLLIGFLILQRGIRAATGTGHNILYYSTDSRIDGLLIGCLASMVYFWKLAGQGFLTSGAFRRLFLASLIVGSCIFITFSYNDRQLYYGFISLFSLSVAITILWLISNESTLIHRFLENSALRWIGKISYGLYLWHFFFFTVAKKQFDGIPQQVALGLTLSFAAAVLSFYFVERPILTLKDTLQRRKTPRLSEVV
jgi:peptidoglycan/LPS O-acetylase OafA/YrhL